MAWFDLKGDARLGACATQGCGQQPIYRFEGGGIGSNFCSVCREVVEQQTRKCFDALAQGGISDRLSNFDDYGDRIRGRS